MIGTTEGKKKGLERKRGLIGSESVCSHLSYIKNKETQAGFVTEKQALKCNHCAAPFSSSVVC